MSSKRIVIALGGNAIKQADEEGTTEEQFKNIDITARELVKLIKEGYELVVTHGNGPQAGALLIQQEEAKDIVPAQTLAVCGAMTQGQIGWMMQNRISYYLLKQGIQIPVASVVTQVLVSEDDPDFLNPTKPVGPFLTEEEALKLKTEKNYIVKEVKPGQKKGWRRVVPSPAPLDIVEREVVNRMLNEGILVIACGGGGIPVIKNKEGGYDGIDAVIDKDRAGLKLAMAVNADKFIILTDVEKAYLNYNKPNQQALNTITADEAEHFLKEGHFLKGSMGPKVEACIYFARLSNREAIITSLDKVLNALNNETGTHVIP
ncbi:MAG: carbamate kinase [Tepidanaerobacteraceae bacterium]|jgi:carbamate kinase